jgi:signal transduction histidine kinase
LKTAVDAFGQGRLDSRAGLSGRDEVAMLAASFNQAADRIEALLAARKTLLANASHELRSPLARLKMAVAMYAELPEPRRRFVIRVPIARIRRHRRQRRERRDDLALLRRKHDRAAGQRLSPGHHPVPRPRRAAARSQR